MTQANAIGMTACTIQTVKDSIWLAFPSPHALSLFSDIEKSEKARKPNTIRWASLESGIETQLNESWAKCCLCSSAGNQTLCESAPPHFQKIVNEDNVRNVDEMPTKVIFENA